MDHSRFLDTNDPRLLHYITILVILMKFQFAMIWAIAICMGAHIFWMIREPRPPSVIIYNAKS